MRLRNLKNDLIYPCTIRRHDKEPTYFETSKRRRTVRINGKSTQMVLHPTHIESNRVNFRLQDDDQHKISYVDDPRLLDEIASEESNLEFETFDGRRIDSDRGSVGARRKSSTKKVRLLRKPSPCNCPTKYEFHSIKDLHDACKNKVECDNQAFGMKSVYLPNPVCRPNPPFALISLEPSISMKPIISDADLTPDEFEELVKEHGFKNWTRSDDGFILRYCQHHFLGNSLITDFSKGAMPVENAGDHRIERFQRWLPLLRAELEFFGNPTVYALGGEAEKYLKKYRIPYAKVTNPDGQHINLLHPSPQNNGRFVEYMNHKYSDEALRNDNTAESKKLRKFANELMKNECFSIELIERIKPSLFVRQLTSTKGRFLYYRDMFTQIRASIGLDYPPYRQSGN